jgi:hypothetical protein
MHEKAANEGAHRAVLGFFPAATLRDQLDFSVRRCASPALCSVPEILYDFANVAIASAARA